MFFLAAAAVASTVYVVNYAVKKGAAAAQSPAAADNLADAASRNAYVPPSGGEQAAPQPAPAVQPAPAARQPQPSSAQQNFPFDINLGTINTIAGTGQPGFTGNEILIASQSLLNRPCAVRADNYSNIYVLDCGNRRLRKIFPNGNISTVAGNMRDNFPANNSSAQRFSLQDPVDFIWDPDGNVYIADAGLNRILKVDENRLLTFFAGNGTNKNDGDGGQAFNAGIANPAALASDDNGNIFVYTDGAVRKIDKRGIITTVTDAPKDMHCRAVDKDGSLYFARGNQIFKTYSDGRTTIVAGTGKAGFFGDGLPADMAELNAPDCVALSPDGRVVIADTGNNAVRRITFNR